MSCRLRFAHCKPACRLHAHFVDRECNRKPEYPMRDFIVLAGSDPRLESEAESGRDQFLHFAAPLDGSRVALYGPYLDLPPGNFRIELAFSVSKRTPGLVKIELCHRGASVMLYRRTCFDWELGPGLIQITQSFEQGVEGLEVRMIVPPGFAGAIHQLSVVQLSHDLSPGAGPPARSAGVR